MEALNGLNRAFYLEYAAEFSATRSRPWPGWERVVEHLRCRLDDFGRSGCAVLDLGCGNGRFASFLTDRLDRPIDYCGVDASEQLLAEARTRSPGGGSWRGRYLQADIVLGGLDELPVEATFDLVVLFGLLHHVPSLARRRELLTESAGLLRSGGLLVVSFWQFGSSQRFAKRVIRWHVHNRQAADKISLRELEHGDLLLAWGEPSTDLSGSARRYCHYADSREAAALVESVDLKLFDRFTSDGEGGQQNLYFVLG